MHKKTFRFFVSSTFSDFNEERRLLQQYVFPEIKKYCKSFEKDYKFQAIDLRWGVSDEAQLNQKTLALCINEVHSSKSQPHPNFLIMAGDRYGWIPCPYSIEEREFKKIYNYIEAHNTMIHLSYPKRKDRAVESLKLLTQWYKKDKNQIPTSYILQERTKRGSIDYKKYENWLPEENALRKLLQDTVEKIEDIESKKYFTSATEAEVVEGIYKYYKETSNQKKLQEENQKLNIDYADIDYKNVFGYIRTIHSIEDKVFQSDFLDTDHQKETSKIQKFKKKLRASLKKQNILEVDADITELSKDPKNSSLHYRYSAIENEENSLFVKKMYNYIKKSIDDFDKAYKEEELSVLSLEDSFKEKKLEHFIGRESALNAIESYIESKNINAMIIHAPSGSGKSVLMAKAVEKTKKNKIYRFVGASSSLSTTVELLISILNELGIHESRKIIDDKENTYESVEEFYARVHEHLLHIKDPVVLFIDAVDQLANIDNFSWLPKKLPGSLKIIISVLDDEQNYPEDTKYFTYLKYRTNNLYKLEPFYESKKVIKEILKKYDRRVQAKQMDYLETLYKNVHSPLYLSIAAQEMKHWKSTNPIKSSTRKGVDLAPSQKLIVMEFIENLHKIYHHDEMFIRRVFTFLVFADGLSEYELFELIATDECFVKKLAPETYHTNITGELPAVIWARLQTQIEPFLKYENINGHEIMKFFHREFTDAVLKNSETQKEAKELLKATLKLFDKETSIETKKNYVERVVRYNIRYQDDDTLREYAELLAQRIGSYEYYSLLENRDYSRDELLSIEKFRLYFAKYFHDREEGDSALYYIALKKLSHALKATKHLFEAKKLDEIVYEYEKNKLRIQRPKDYVLSINDLAASLIRKGDYTNAINKLESSIPYANTLIETGNHDAYNAYTVLLTNLATAYFRRDPQDLHKAIEYYEEASLMAQKCKKNPIKMQMCHKYYITIQNHLAKAYSKSTNTYDKAIEIVTTALFGSLGNIELLIESAQTLSTLYIEKPECSKDDYEKAKFFSSMALNKAGVELSVADVEYHKLSLLFLQYVITLAEHKLEGEKDQEYAKFLAMIENYSLHEDSVAQSLLSNLTHYIKAENRDEKMKFIEELLQKDDIARESFIYVLFLHNNSEALAYEKLLDEMGFSADIPYSVLSVKDEYRDIVYQTFGNTFELPSIIYYMDGEIERIFPLLTKKIEGDIDDLIIIAHNIAKKLFNDAIDLDTLKDALGFFDLNEKAKLIFSQIFDLDTLDVYSNFEEMMKHREEHYQVDPNLYSLIIELKKIFKDKKIGTFR